MKRSSAVLNIPDDIILKGYKKCRRRWTFRGQQFNGLNILSNVKDQREAGDKCSFFSCTTAFESQLRLQGVNASFSPVELEDKVNARMIDEPLFAKKGRVERCFLVMRDVGLQDQNSKVLYKIRNFRKFCTNQHGHINEALKNFLHKGPMVGVFRLDPFEFGSYGEKKIGIYSWSLGKRDLKRSRLAVHAVCVTGFGVDCEAPFFEFQNSYGSTWHSNGFGEIYPLDFIELYGFGDIIVS